MVKVIGAGLAGVEASYYLANKGIVVSYDKLYLSRNEKSLPASVFKAKHGKVVELLGVFYEAVDRRPHVFKYLSGRRVFFGV